MQIALSWGCVLPAIASALAAIKTGQYVLLLGIPISLAALPVVTFAPIVRNLATTAAKDAAIPAPVRVVAWFFARFSFAVKFLWPVALAALLLTDHFVGAWLVGTYVFASNTVRWYGARYLPPFPVRDMANVAPGETAAGVQGMFATPKKRGTEMGVLGKVIFDRFWLIWIYALITIITAVQAIYRSSFGVGAAALAACAICLCASSALFSSIAARHELSYRPRELAVIASIAGVLTLGGLALARWSGFHLVLFGAIFSAESWALIGFAVGMLAANKELLLK